MAMCFDNPSSLWNQITENKKCYKIICIYTCNQHRVTTAHTKVTTLLGWCQIDIIPVPKASDGYRTYKCPPPLSSNPGSAPVNSWRIRRRSQTTAGDRGIFPHLNVKVCVLFQESDCNVNVAVTKEILIRGNKAIQWDSDNLGHKLS